MDAATHLEAALTTVDKLDRLCCTPDRSPRMAALREAIEGARDAIDDPAEVAARLEDAGAQVGSLQIGCCAPARMPLYAAVLDDLTRARLAAGPDMHA
jgi:hypothetical protein